MFSADPFGQLKNLQNVFGRSVRTAKKPAQHHVFRTTERGVRANAELGVRANTELGVRANERTNERTNEKVSTVVRFDHSC